MNLGQGEPTGWLLAKGTHRRHTVVLSVAAAFATLGVAAVVAQAQTTTTTAGPSFPSPNCAVTTIKLGGLSATEFFGLSGGPTGFSQSFGIQAGSEGPSALRCIRLELDNPTPGDLVPIGGYVIQGFAFDPNTPAGQGSGIKGVQVFLDDPDQGGIAVGEAATGASAGGTAANQFRLPNGRAAGFGDQFANSGFRVTVQIPASANGAGHVLFVATQSLAGNRLGAVAVPIAVGALTPLPRLAPMP
jgi:hypothetical protein